MSAYTTHDKPKEQLAEIARYLGWAANGPYSDKHLLGRFRLTTRHAMYEAEISGVLRQEAWICDTADRLRNLIQAGLFFQHTSDKTIWRYHDSAPNSKCGDSKDLDGDCATRPDALECLLSRELEWTLMKIQNG